MPAKRTPILFVSVLPVLAAVGYQLWVLLNGLVPGVLGPQSADAPIYETEIVSRGEIRKSVTGSGVVKPLMSVLVGSQLSGQIAEIKVNFNSEVEAGDVLAVLDDKAYQSRVTQARAELAVARSALINQKAALKKAEAIKQHAERILDRQQSLARSKITTGERLDDARRDALVSQSEIAIVEAQIASAQSNVEHREALLQQALIDLEHTKIRAPVKGIVLSRLVEVGQTVAASLQAPELFRIAQNLERVQIEAQIGEAEIGGVQKGNSVSFSVDAYPDTRFEGTVASVRLAPNIEQNIVTYTVVVDVNNSDRSLYPGMTAIVKIETARKENVARVPLDALRYRPQDAASPAPGDNPANKVIWVLGAGGTAEPRSIRIGLSDANNVEISGGDVGEGTQIILKKRQTGPE